MSQAEKILKKQDEQKQKELQLLVDQFMKEYEKLQEKFGVMLVPVITMEGPKFIARLIKKNNEEKLYDSTKKGNIDNTIKDLSKVKG